jgi:ribosomal protein L44E
MKQEVKMYCRECEEWHLVDISNVETVINLETNEIEFTGYCPECGDMMEHEVPLGGVL